VIVGAAAFIAGNRLPDINDWFVHKSSPSQLDFSSLDTFYSTLRAKYDGNIDASKLIDGAEHGLVSALGDPYTVYMNADEAKAFDSDLNGTFEGIGAELATVNGKLSIVSIIGGSPAQKAGLETGDAITGINGQDTSGMSVASAVTRIRGKAGTTVKLTIMSGSQKPRDVSITRAAITDPSVKTKVVNGYGIMTISRFGDDTAGLAQQAAADFKNQHVEGVVLDLRGDGGGLLSAAQSVASLWLKNKVIVTERTDGKITDTLHSSGDATLYGLPTVVLIDGNSASASEIVAGALHDNHAATLAGEKSFGKGSVQSVIPLGGGGELKVTIAKWYTPNGININKQGIEPDVKAGISASDIKAGRDPQKDKALQLLSQGL
jgi:carboxyl-terminal processing protease